MNFHIILLSLLFYLIKNSFGYKCISCIEHYNSGCPDSSNTELVKDDCKSCSYGLLKNKDDPNEKRATYVCESEEKTPGEYGEANFVIEKDLDGNPSKKEFSGSVFYCDSEFCNNIPIDEFGSTKKPGESTNTATDGDGTTGTGSESETMSTNTTEESSTKKKCTKKPKCSKKTTTAPGPISATSGDGNAKVEIGLGGGGQLGGPGNNINANAEDKLKLNKNGSSFISPDKLSIFAAATVSAFFILSRISGKFQ